MNKTATESAEAAKTAPALDPAAAGAGNLDKVREILFGAQTREHERRLARLEESLQAQTAEIRETTRKRLDGLESFIRKELAAVETRLRAEREERTAADRECARETKSQGEEIARKLAEINDAMASIDRDLRGQIFQLSKDLTEAMHAGQAEAAAVLDRRFQELSHLKADRSAIAGLLSEVAMRLNDEFRIPGVES
jgi:hypothetical protein